jgi:hypothetical protein
VVDRFCTTPSGLEVVVVVVVSEDDEGGGVTTAAGGGAAPYSVVVVSLVAVGPHAVQKPTANAPTDMRAHDFKFCIFLILQKKSMSRRNGSICPRSLARGNLRSRPACFGQTNSDRLFAALHLLA